MKATTQQAAGFKPIELTITIESIRELRFLYELFNTPAGDLSELLIDSSGDKEFNITSSECHGLVFPIWEQLKQHISN